MPHKIRFADRDASPAAGPLARGLKGFITVGVWVLVALAGFTVWARLTA